MKEEWECHGESTRDREAATTLHNGITLHNKLLYNHGHDAIPQL
jgi:hypothetical protein